MNYGFRDGRQEYLPAEEDKIVENWRSTTDTRQAMLGWLASYWKEVLITTVVVVVALLFVPRLQPYTSHVAAQTVETRQREVRSPDIWPFSLHVKRLTD